MKKYIYILFVSILSCLLFISCKKESSNDLQIVTGEQLRAIKKYYESQQGNIDEGVPQWEKTIYDAEQGKYLAPVIVSQQNAPGKYIINKYVVISDESNQLAGEYVFALEKISSNKGSSDQQIQNAILEDINIADIILAKRKLQHTSSNSVRFGNYINTKVKKEQKNDTTIVANSLPVANCEANGGTLVEIEWWYQEYDQYGNVVYEEYVYSTYECWGSGGGGSGGGTGTSTACGSMTSAQARALLDQLEGEIPNQVTYTSIGLEDRNGESNTIENFGNIRKVLLPKYSFYTLRLTKNNNAYAVTWFANFSGIVYKQSENDFWKWESINFVNVSKEGNEPPCVDYQMTANVASPIIEADKKRAQSAVSYYVASKAPCIGGWQFDNKSGSLSPMYLDAQ